MAALSSEVAREANGLLLQLQFTQGVEVVRSAIRVRPAPNQ